MKKRIKSNFYTDCYFALEPIPSEKLQELREADDYWKYRTRYYVKRKLPDNRLYSGWSKIHPTKITPSDLPPDYILLHNYKKHGYIRTAGVVDVVYHPSPFHNHAFKDDFLYISYTSVLGEYKEGYGEDSTFIKCDEYIFGNDIVDFVLAAEKNSPQFDFSEVKKKMVDQYNAYCDEMNEWPAGPRHNHIDKLEEL